MCPLFSGRLPAKLNNFKLETESFLFLVFLTFFQIFPFFLLGNYKFLSRLLTTIKKLLGYCLNLSQDNRKNPHGELSILFRSKVMGFRTVFSQFQATLIESPAIPSFTLVVSSNSFYIPAYRNISHFKLSVLGDRCFSKT